MQCQGRGVDVLSLPPRTECWARLVKMLLRVWDDVVNPPSVPMDAPSGRMLLGIGNGVEHPSRHWHGPINAGLPRPTRRSQLGAAGCLALGGGAHRHRTHSSCSTYCLTHCQWRHDKGLHSATQTPCHDNIQHFHLLLHGCLLLNHHEQHHPSLVLLNFIAE